MKHSILVATFLNLGILLGSSTVSASPNASSDPLAQEEQACEKIKNKPEWVQELKTRHRMTDSQIAQLKNKGLSYPQMAMIGKISERSGQTVDQLLQKRQQPEMSWMKLAVATGVPPTEVVQSVAQIRMDLVDKPLQYEQRERARRRAASEQQQAEAQARAQQKAETPQLNETKETNKAEK